MVTQHPDKRLALAHNHHTSATLKAKAEVGVCMGFDHVTGRTLFVLANGAIVPRRPTSQFPSTYIPFNWTPKTFTMTSYLPIPSTSQSPSQLPLNSVVQLPYTPHTSAINSIIDHVPGIHEPPPSSDLLLQQIQSNVITHVPTIPATTRLTYNCRLNLNNKLCTRESTSTVTLTYPLAEERSRS